LLRNSREFFDKLIHCYFFHFFFLSYIFYQGFEGAISHALNDSTLVSPPRLEKNNAQAVFAGRINAAHYRLTIIGKYLNN